MKKNEVHSKIGDRSSTLTCQLCDRQMQRLTEHHLIPRQAVKRKKADPGSTVEICSACHKQIHTFFNNAELAREFNTLEKLKNEPRMQKFLGWIQKQEPNKRIRVHRAGS
jgi:hypothetical protein